MTTEDTITVEAHEVEGVRTYAEFLLGCDDAFPRDPAEWERAHKRIGWLLDLRDALGTSEPPVVLEPSPFLEEFARGAGEDGRERIGYVLSGNTTAPLSREEQEAHIRECKGLISFADRLGVYEGVVV